MKTVNFNKKNSFVNGFNKVKMSFASVFAGDATSNQQMVVYGVLTAMGILAMIIVCSITGTLGSRF